MTDEEARGHVTHGAALYGVEIGIGLDGVPYSILKARLVEGADPFAGEMPEGTEDDPRIETMCTRDAETGLWSIVGARMESPEGWLYSDAEGIADDPFETARAIIDPPAHEGETP